MLEAGETYISQRAHQSLVRKRDGLGKHRELSGKWLIKNPFLPIQMILENRAVFTPGLLCNVVVREGCRDANSYYPDFYPWFHGKTLPDPGLLSLVLTQEVGNLKGKFHFQRTHGAVS